MIFILNKVKRSGKLGLKNHKKHEETTDKKPVFFNTQFNPLRWKNRSKISFFYAVFRLEKVTFAYSKNWPYSGP